VGKEVCDLLVVFDPHIIIFSDKSCAIAYSGNTERDWGRWYRRAVERSARQAWGAERWIREHSDRLFLDPQCKRRYPYPLPDPANAVFHRIVVARGAGIRSYKELGGSGSLMVAPRITGEQHALPVDQGGFPFAIGDIDPGKGYVHVLDDTTLFVLLQTLDTIADFTAYLGRKERFARSGKLVMAAGEEDLLAHYLKNLGPDGEHDFVVPTKVQGAVFEEGIWKEFSTNPQRLAQLKANEISYAWDRLIEIFSQHAFNESSFFTTHPGFANQERLLRVLAAENRTRRRVLAASLFEILERTPPSLRATRVLVPQGTDHPYYVFLLLPWRTEKSEHENRLVRRNFLEACCLITRLKFPDAKQIVGLATESGRRSAGSEDLLLFDGDNWNPELEAEARRLQDDLGILKEPTMTPFRASEYPELPVVQRTAPPRTGQPGFAQSRNGPCPCGSGKRFKHCHGKT
jgi:hypothetical protein